MGPRVPPSEVCGDGEQTRTYLYVDDCVDALVRLASVTSGGARAIVTIGPGHLISVNGAGRKWRCAWQVSGRTWPLRTRPSGPGVRGYNYDFAPAAELLQRNGSKGEERERKQEGKQEGEGKQEEAKPAIL